MRRQSTGKGGCLMLRSFSSPLAYLLIFLFLPLFAYAQRSFTVGTASASPGEKATGHLEVPAGPVSHRPSPAWPRELAPRRRWQS
jgi:hypothetical protein